MKKDGYFLYVRKSTDTEDKQVQSLDDQINIMKKKADILWLYIIDIFSESMSAKAPWRYRFNEMIERIYKWEAKWIIAWKIDRLTRNPIDTWTIQFMLQNWTLEKIITNDRDYNPVDAWLLFSVETWMSNQFILDLKKNVKRWMDSKTDKWVFCWKAPEWYINNRLDKTIEIDSERYHLVRKMWDLMLSWDYSVPRIVTKIDEEWKFKRKRRWTLWWTPITLSWMYKTFTNPFYTWDFMWNWEIRKWTHKAMVTYEEFYRVQQLLWNHWRTVKAKTKEFSYTWIIRCWECWSMITATEREKVIKATWEKRFYIYYLCTKKRKWCECCSQKPIKLEDLEHQINTILNNIDILPEFKERAINIIKRDFNKELEEKNNIKLNIEKQIKDNEKKLVNLIDLLTDWILEKEDYILKKKSIIIDINNSKQKLENIDKNMEYRLDVTERLFDFVMVAKTKFNYWDIKIKRVIFSALGENFILKDWKLGIELHSWLKPIEINWWECKREYRRLEPIEKGIKFRETNALTGRFLLWYSYGELNPSPSLEKAMS